MKKKLTLAMMVITIIEAVCMFIPGIVELGSKDMNAFAGFRGENAGIANTFSKITLFLLVASFVCLFSALLEKRNILSKLSAWLPLASFVSLLAFVGGCSQIDYENYAGYRYQIGRLGSILVIISVVSAVFHLSSNMQSSMTLRQKRFRSVRQAKQTKSKNIKTFLTAA